MWALAFDFRAVFQEQRAQQGAVAARLVGAVAAHGEIGVPRQRGDEIERAAVLRVPISAW